MSTTRREFLTASAAALAAASLLPRSLRAQPLAKSDKPLKILILGGTGFLGPACTDSALARGHKVTLFNSGRTEDRRKQAGRPSVVPAGVEELHGNRDPNKTADDRKVEGKPDAVKDPESPKGLTQLEGKKWDAVIDTSAYFPRMAKSSAELLAPNVRQYVFISTISVYQRNDIPNYDESAAVKTLDDPATEEMGQDYANYGGGKAMCEKACEAAMPGRVTNIRPGFIVGPRDSSGRFMYWPLRASMGGEMVVPGDPQDPIQIIDVRDLSDWIIHCIENNITGVFNATGPAKELSMKAMVEGVRQGVASDATLTWIDNEFLVSRGIREGQFPLYAPPSGETAGFHRCNIAKAVGKGMKFRSVGETAKATLDWYKSLPADIQPRIAPQLAKREGEEEWVETEKKLVEAWKKREKK